MFLRLLFPSIMSLLILSGCNNIIRDYSDINNITEIISQPVIPKYVTIKYRSDHVDIANFEVFDTSRSSLVRGAWYDEKNTW